MYKSYGNQNTNGIDVCVKNKNAKISVSVPTKTNPDVNVCIGNNSSGSDKFFRFTQAVASDVWEVNHNLNKFPSVTVVDSANDVVVGDIKYIDKNNVVITFSASFVGKAYFN